MVMIDDKYVRFFIGDVRGKDHLVCALIRTDYAVYAADATIVPAAEYKFFKCVKAVVANQIDPTLIGCCREMRSMG